MRVVFMGTPDFAVPCLEQLITKSYQVAAVYTQPDKPVGRGRFLIPSPVKRAALGRELPVLQPVSLKAAEAVAQLSAFQPDIIVVAAYGQMLPQPVLDIPKYRCINVHASLLPKYRGASPVTAALLAGDDVTGISVMLMEAGMDTGPVLTREQVPVGPQDTTGTLTARLSAVAARVLVAILPRWIKGGITPEPQNDAEATYCKPVSKGEGKLDWRLPAVDIWRQVRAFQPWPGCFTRWQGRRLEIVEAVPLPGETKPEPGRVVAFKPAKEGADFGIHTGEGILGVLQVQMEGKRVMPAAEFLRGQRQLIGAVLTAD